MNIEWVARASSYESSFFHSIIYVRYLLNIHLRFAHPFSQSDPAWQYDGLFRKNVELKDAFRGKFLGSTYIRSIILFAFTSKLLRLSIVRNLSHLPGYQ